MTDEAELARIYGDTDRVSRENYDWSGPRTCEQLDRAIIAGLHRVRAETALAEREACAKVAESHRRPGYITEDIAATIRARTATQAEGKPAGMLHDKTDDWDFRHAKRRVIKQTGHGFVARDLAAPQPPASLLRINPAPDASPARQPSYGSYRIDTQPPASPSHEGGMREALEWILSANAGVSDSDYRALATQFARDALAHDGGRG